MREVTSRNKPIIWSIGGSDCSGGAGIAADIKTGHAIGVEVCHLITANTVQNSKYLLSVNSVAMPILAQQAKALSDDKRPDAIKIGLLVSKEQVRWLVNLLKQLRLANPTLAVVFDPVGHASVGGSLSQLPAEELLPLMPLIDVLTPNLDETKTLQTIALSSNQTPSSTSTTAAITATTQEHSSEHEAENLASSILKLGVNAVIVKGGHGDTDVSKDICLQRIFDEVKTFRLCSSRISTQYSHGGGCSFASAIASYLARGYLLRDAFALAKAFINRGLSFNKNKHDRYGAFEQIPSLKMSSQVKNHTESSSLFPRVVDDIHQQFANLLPFECLGILRSDNQALGLYPVIDSLEWLERLLPLELNIIQLRVKKFDDPDQLEKIIAAAIEMYRDSNTRLFINDYWQLAIKYNAYGVHIGQEDLQDADLRAIQQAGIRLGISTHGCYEFLLAQQLQPSYLAIGAIFPTKTKDMTGQIQGLENLMQILSLAKNIPVVAIGGINLKRAPKVWRTGVDSIAVVTAITEAKSPENAVAEFQQILEQEG